MLKIINRLIGGNKSAKEIKLLQPLVDLINHHYNTLSELSHDELRKKTISFKNCIKENTSPAIQKIKEVEERIAQKEKEDDISEVYELSKKLKTLHEERDKASEKSLNEILPEAFAVMKETARRFSKEDSITVNATELDRDLATQKDYITIDGEKATYNTQWNAAGVEVSWNMVHYDVQLMGGIILHKGKIAEMATGEGKTLVSTLPAYLNALGGEGVHIVTVNDYLARRDSEWNTPLFEWLGITVGCIDKYEPHSKERMKAYQSDITYGTNNEFGFDYLRDNMVQTEEEITQRKHHYAIIDEVDSVLIDDARTPLIISGPVEASQDQETYLRLQPRIATLVEAQRQIVTKALVEAKKQIKAENDGPKEGGLQLIIAYKGLPKNSALIKFLSEPGVRVKLQKIESFYISDQQKEMYRVEDELYFVIDEKSKSVHLTDKGVAYLAKNEQEEDLFILPDIASELEKIEQDNSLSETEKVEKKDSTVKNYAEKADRLHATQQLLKAYALFQKDVEYIVVDSQVKIVDEQTGRVMEGRRYSDGLHQALEAKEKVDIEASSQTYATISLQNYFRMYRKLAGMTGTAETEAGELWNIYQLDVTVIPTHQPVIREDSDDLIYKTQREKYKAIIEAIQKYRGQGRPILVGTTSVESSELISKMLQGRKIPHNVLNAKQHQKEAQVIAEAGMAGNVTIATNMAGRGTDIKLGEGVKDNGGLVILGTERHESRRVDRQLRGRAGRQGDPGGSQFFVSLEDELMRLFGSERIAKWMDRLGLKEGEVIQHSMVTGSITRAQKKVEENNFGIRKRLLDYDDVMNKQRNVIYQRRKHALYGSQLRLDIDNAIFELCYSFIKSYTETNDKNMFSIRCLQTFGLDPDHLENIDKITTQSIEGSAKDFYEKVMAHYRSRNAQHKEIIFPIFKRMYTIHGDKEKARVRVPYTNGSLVLQVPTPLTFTIETEGKTIISSLEKSVVLAFIDRQWKEHLRTMENLRQSVQTAYIEQKDPLVIYKIESYNLFEQTNNELNQQIVSFLLHYKPAATENQQEPQAVIQEKENKLISKRKLRTRKDSAVRALETQNNYYEPSNSSAENQPLRVEKETGRNKSCPCGSGKKYKHCHGKS